MIEPAWLTSSASGASAPARPDRPRQRRPSSIVRRRRALLVGVLGTAVLAAATAGGFVLDSRGNGATEPPAAPEVPDTSWCAGLGSGEPASVDSPDPGAAAIAGFEWGYYVARDGARARAHVAPDARVGSAERLDREGIGALPVGTTHCVLAKKVVDGLYIVDVWERRPDDSTRHFPQTIRTTGTSDGALIISISARE